MKILKIIKKFFETKKIIDKYCLFNKKLFKEKYSSNKNSEILIEFNGFQVNHTGLAAMSNVLAKKFDAKISAYIGYSFVVSPLKYNMVRAVKWFFGNFLNLKTFKIYRSFNTEKIFKPTINKETTLEAEKIFKKIWPKIKKKDDILEVKLNGVYLGDLIYDTYIKANFLPTIEIKDPKFKAYFYDFLLLFIFWQTYFKNHNVKAVIASHPVYTYALPLRVAASLKVSAYVLDIEHFFKVTEKNLYQLSDCKDYKKIAKSLSKLELKKGMTEAKNKLNQRFSGGEGLKIDYPELQKSAFNNKSFKPIIKKNNKIKILICTHEYFDAPHIFGKNLFPDFYEWLECLGKISNETSNYDWYIKTHPRQPGDKYARYQPLNLIHIKELIKKYKNIKLLPDSYSHQQIIKEKINFVLTTYGSVAFEYPLFNIPVIMATKNHTHRLYDFIITPKSQKEYRYTLKNLKNLNCKINKKNKQNIYEYYYIRFIKNSSLNWMVDYSKAIKRFKYWSAMFSNEFYEFYMNEFKEDKFRNNSKKYLEYINSNQYRIKSNHLQ